MNLQNWMLSSDCGVSSQSHAYMLDYWLSDCCQYLHDMLCFLISTWQTAQNWQQLCNLIDSSLLLDKQKLLARWSLQPHMCCLLAKQAKGEVDEESDETCKLAEMIEIAAAPRPEFATAWWLGTQWISQLWVSEDRSWQSECWTNLCSLEEAARPVLPSGHTWWQACVQTRDWWIQCWCAPRHCGRYLKWLCWLVALWWPNMLSWHKLHWVCWAHVYCIEPMSIYIAMCGPTLQNTW